MQDAVAVGMKNVLGGEKIQKEVVVNLYKGCSDWVGAEVSVIPRSNLGADFRLYIVET